MESAQEIKVSKSDSPINCQTRLFRKCTHYFSQSDFLGSFYCPDGGKIHEIDTGNEQDENGNG